MAGGVVTDRLYLIGLVANFEDGTNTSRATLFPKFPNRCLPTDTLTCPPQGKPHEAENLDRKKFFRRILGNVVEQVRAAILVLAALPAVIHMKVKVSRN